MQGYFPSSGPPRDSQEHCAGDRGEGQERKSQSNPQPRDGAGMSTAPHNRLPEKQVSNTFDN